MVSSPYQTASSGVKPIMWRSSNPLLLSASNKANFRILEPRQISSKSAPSLRKFNISFKMLSRSKFVISSSIAPSMTPRSSEKE